MLGTKVGHVSEPNKKKVVVAKSKNEISKAHIEESTAEFNHYHQNRINGPSENLEENKGDETHEESGVNPEDMMEEEPEEDPEGETYEESDSEKETVEEHEEEHVYEEIDGEPEEDPEEEIVEEPEEDPEEETVGEPEEELVCEEIDGEPEGDPEEETVEEPEKEHVCEEIDGEPEEDPEEEIAEEPEEDPEGEINEESGEEGLAAENSHLSSATSGYINSKHMGDEPDDNPEEKRVKKLAEESSGKCRKSRWDLKQEGETREIDGNSKRRKTRWDDNDSQNCLINPYGFIDPLELLMDPKTRRLKAKLMMVNKKLQSSEIHDERPLGERSPSPEPVYNDLGVIINTRDARMRQKLIIKRNQIVCKLAKRYLTPAKFVKKIFVPVKEYPSYNFVGLILGPKGNTQKKIEKETGAKILLRGRGSGDPELEDEDLHVRVEAYNQRALDAAVVMIEKLLIPVADQNNDHKRAQLVELAKLKAMYKDNRCELCKEQGHRKYAWPLQDSTFKAVCCDICGSFGHLASSCNASKDKSNKEVDNANLYVGYLPHAIDDKRLKELFLPFGKIMKTVVIKDQTTGLSKGYGFVKFEDPLDAAAARKYMHGYQMEGKMLAVRVAGQRPMVGPVHPGHFPAVPSNILGQTACSYGPVTYMLPEAPFSTPNNDSLSFPSSDSYSGHNINVASTQTDLRLANCLSSGHDFSVQIPTSLPDSVSQFPGDPDYRGSQFKSCFAGPAMNETPNRVPETAENSSFLFDFRFP